MHRIHLRKPWSVAADGEGLQWRRHFGRPANLGPDERVWLVVEGFPAAGSVSLNSEPLGTLSGQATPARFEITGRLRARNELVIWVPSAGAASGAHGADVPNEAAGSSPPGQVRLEIGPG